MRITGIDDAGVAHGPVELSLEARATAHFNHDFDAWFAYTGETAAPRPVTRREDTLLEETLYEEAPAAIGAARGRHRHGHLRGVGGDRGVTTAAL